MSYIAGRDTIRGTDGMIYLVHPDGNYEELIQVLNVEAIATINQDEVPRIGTRSVGHKVSSITFEGTATAYYGNPAMRKIFMDYLHGGAYPNLTIAIANCDPETQALSQVMLLNHVVFTNQCLAKLDAESTSLQEDLEFSFENPVEFNSFAETKGEISNDMWKGVID